MNVMGLPLLIEWDKFQPGTSFFVPCVNQKEVEKFVLSEAKRMRLGVVTKRVVENNILGLRVWRDNAKLSPHSSFEMD